MDAERQERIGLLRGFALLQEAAPPPPDVAFDVHPPRDHAWQTARHDRPRWRTVIARISDRVNIAPWVECAIGEWGPRAIAVCRAGTLAVADVTCGNETFTVVSAYAFWESPVASARSKWIYADASAHRLISDIAALVGREEGHRIIVAGDFNLLRGYGENGSAYWARRYATVFERFEAMGIPFVGPEYPSGRQADPRPDELPENSKCVPTFHHSRQTPATATRQMDFVFASRSLHARTNVRAMNGIDEWGPSDHCRVVIEVG